VAGDRAQLVSIDAVVCDLVGHDQMVLREEQKPVTITEQVLTLLDQRKTFLGGWYSARPIGCRTAKVHGPPLPVHANERQRLTVATPRNQ
jgi:hypothetical protein